MAGGHGAKQVEGEASDMLKASNSSQNIPLNFKGRSLHNVLQVSRQPILGVSFNLGGMIIAQLD